MSCKTQKTNMRNFRFPFHILELLKQLATQNGTTMTGVLIRLIKDAGDAELVDSSQLVGR